ncbi:MAG: M16 family metallopeptidase [Candidatus Eiseniibacteriota bacterium]
MRNLALRLALAGVVALATVVALPAALVTAADKNAATYVVPKPFERSLKNQMKVYLIEDHSLPRVHFRFVIRAGSAHEPAEKAGLANMTLAVMRQGTEEKDAKALSEAIEGMGGQITTDASRDYSTVSGTFLARDARKGLDLIADIVRQPAFRREEVERQRSQIQAALQSSRDQNATLASEHLAALVYGEHPYGRPTDGDPGSVSNITRDDLLAYHQLYVRPNLALLVIVGDFDPTTMMSDIEAQFQTWEKAEAPSRPGPDLPAFDATRIRLLDKPDVTQTELRIGFEGVPRSNPDFITLQVMNYILGGGGFSSRLVENARARGGLTYSANTSFDPGLDKGAFVLSTFTKNESVGPMIDVCRSAIRDFQVKGPTSKEVEDAKRFLVGALPFGFQTADGIAAQWAAVDLYGLGTDYFDRYAERVRAVTPEQVKQAADKYLRDDRLAIVAVSTASAVKPALDAVGTVEVLDYRSPTGTIPQSKPSAALPSDLLTPESAAKAKAVIDRALEAHGGAPRLKSLADVSVRQDIKLTTPNGTLDGQMAVSVRLPDRTRIEFTMLGQRGVQVLNGEEGWATQGGKVQELSAEQIQSMKSGIKVQVLPLLSHLAEGQVPVGYAGEEKVGEEAVDVVQVADPEAIAKLSFSKKSGLLLRLEQEEPAMFGQGKVPMARLYSDYRAVDGFQVPWKTERYAHGQRIIEDTVTAYDVNKGVADSQFKRPPR